MLVTLTTDFGDSAFTGALRGSILSACPAARVVDVTNAIPAQDVVQGALALYAAAPYFPEGTIHVGVVDPGVGTSRAALVVETERGLLVGPDNGLLVPAARRLGLLRARRITDRGLMREPVSPTFHGRDVFGPVAGRLAAGLAPERVGPVLGAFNDLDFGSPRVEDSEVEGTVLAIDPFGNAITNVARSAVRMHLRPGSMVGVAFRDSLLRVPFAATYGDVPPGEALLYEGSAGFLELGLHRGSAAKRFGLGAGDAITLRAA